MGRGSLQKLFPGLNHKLRHCWQRQGEMPWRYGQIERVRIHSVWQVIEGWYEGSSRLHYSLRQDVGGFEHKVRLRRRGEKILQKVKWVLLLHHPWSKLTQGCLLLSLLWKDAKRFLHKRKPLGLESANQEDQQLYRFQKKNRWCCGCPAGKRRADRY